MDYIDKAFMLELSYRLTIAVNMSEHGLASMAWMSSWNDDTLACARQWHNQLLSSVVNDDVAGAMLIQIVNGIITGLAQGYAAMIGNPFAPSQVVHVYRCLLDEAHKLAHAPAFVEWELSEFFIFGQQLAQNDLRAHFSAINKPQLPIAVSTLPKFSPLSKESFPRSWPGWPIDSAFNDCLVRYVANRQYFAGSALFSLGALTSLSRSIVCPSHFPTTVWCWQDWEKNKPWHLFLAGEIFPAPLLVTVKDGNDKAFVDLLKAMDRDKKAGNTLDNCGWVSRNDLWPEATSSNTRSKVWSKLTKTTLAVLGAFESKGGSGKYKNSGAPCRLPAVFAEPNCQIFIEKFK